MSPKDNATSPECYNQSLSDPESEDKNVMSKKNVVEESKNEEF